ncbi:hypothetical protein G6F56_009993 [Rhizopus delemar]|nr:hypothetical protein G6F56_009993 [Rhizopus delemar]
MPNFRLSTLFLLVICIAGTQALYFYLEGSEKKCFIEDLPKETMVIANLHFLLGVYKSEQFSDTHNEWIENKDVKMEITVEELPQGHRIVDTKGTSAGRFTFTSTESGDHSICLSTSSNAWFDNTKTSYF